VLFYASNLDGTDINVICNISQLIAIIQQVCQPHNVYFLQSCILFISEQNSLFNNNYYYTLFNYGALYVNISAVLHARWQHSGQMRHE